MSYPDLRAALSGLLGALPYTGYPRNQTCPICGASRPLPDGPDYGYLRHDEGCARYAAEATAMYHETPFHERETLQAAVQEILARAFPTAGGSTLDRTSRAVLAALDVRVRCRRGP